VIDAKGKIEILRRMVVIAVRRMLRGKLSDGVITAGLSFGLCIERFVENFPRGNAAFATLTGDTKTFAQLADGRGSALVDGGFNLVIGHAFA
jgi:hypothetical protein